MHKIWYLSLVFLVFLACKQKEAPSNSVDESAIAFSFQDMPKIKSVNTNVQQILEDWKEFQQLESSFQVLFKASNSEDLALAVDDLLEKEKVLREGAYPLSFDTSQIKSRQRVFRTFLLKIQASIQDRTDLYGPMKQMLTAYNALRTQFNVIENNKLDINLILDEG